MQSELKKIARYYSELTCEECDLRLQALKNSVLSNTQNVRYLKEQNVRQIYREKYPEYTFLSDEELSKERRYVELLSKYDDYIPEEHIDIILNAHLDEEDYRRHLPRILPPHYNSIELYFVYDSIENDITVFWYVRNGILVITSWKKTREQYFV